MVILLIFSPLTHSRLQIFTVAFRSPNDLFPSSRDPGSLCSDTLPYSNTLTSTGQKGKRTQSIHPRSYSACCPPPSSPFLRVPLYILSVSRPLLHAALQPQSGFCPCSMETPLTLNSLETRRPSTAWPCCSSEHRDHTSLFLGTVWSLGFHGPIHPALPCCPWLFLPSLLC